MSDGGLVLANGNGRMPSVLNENTVRSFGHLVHNLTTLSRTRALQQLLDPNPLRDLDKEFQYPRNMTQWDFRQLYDQEGIAARVVNVYPDECWSVYPELYERETNRRTTFEIAWDGLLEEFDIWHYLHRIDRMSGIGRYGVLLVGFDDGLPLENPVPGLRPDGSREPTASSLKVIYLRAFDETLVNVKLLQSDPTNPRYGKPESYNLQLADANAFQGGILSDPTATLRSQEVHWSRVVHVADDCMSSEVFGTPRLQNVYRRVYDIRKVLGGSAEMFFRGAFPGLSIEMLPELAAEGNTLDEPTKADIFAQLERYMNGLQRYLAWTGMQTKVLAPAIAEPTAHIREQLTYIAASKEVPLRVFIGSEAGQLASTQDAATWNRRVARRQRNYINPRIVKPFVDRLMLVGALPRVKSYNVDWTDLNSLTEEQQASVAMKKAQCLLQYVTSGAETVLPVEYFLVDVLGYTEDRAQTIVQDALTGGRKMLTKELWEAPPQDAMTGADPSKKTGGSRNAQKKKTPSAPRARKRNTTGRNV